jgi:peptidoglycan/xylan/chitin deacetylase (PgdA/CDA1 family)
VKEVLLRACCRLDLFRLFNGWTRNTAAVFMLHRFCRGRTEEGRTAVEHLDSCLGYLKAHGYRVISLSDYVAHAGGAGDLYKTVAFTVDDGYRDFYELAYPVFRKHRCPATVFLATDFVDRRVPQWWDVLRYGAKAGLLEPEAGAGYRDLVQAAKRWPEGEREKVVRRILEAADHEDVMSAEECHPLTWEMIGEMGRQRIEFFPHTESHPILSRLPRHRQLAEVAGSRSTVEKRLGQPSRIFCYPNGRFADFNDETVAVLKESGYRAAVTSEEGFDDMAGNPDLFRLRRYPLPDGIPRFAQLVCGLETLKCRLTGC